MEDELGTRIRKVMNQSGLTHKHFGNTLKNAFQKLLNKKNFKILTALTCHNHMQHNWFGVGPLWFSALH